MPAKLAMVAVDQDFTGPWIRAQGNEKAVEISGLGEGEQVVLESLDGGQINLPQIYNSNGSFALPVCTMFRLVKASSGKNPTTVKVVW